MSAALETRDLTKTYQKDVIPVPVLRGVSMRVDAAEFVSVPRFAFYDLDGTWGIEGHGVDPDIEVDDDPALMVDGGDPQLDAAIELMLEEIKTNTFVPMSRPEYPDRSGMGVPESDW